MKKLIPIYFLISILICISIIPNALAVNYNESHGLTMGSTATFSSAAQGFRFKANVNTTLVAVYKTNYSKPSVAYLTSDASGSTVLAQANFAGDVATFSTPYNLTIGTTYYLVMKQAVDGNYGSSAVSVNHPFINWTGSVVNGADYASQPCIFTSLILNNNTGGGSAANISIRVNNIVDTTTINNFCINATGSNTSQNICTTNGLVTFNTTGIYNISAFNISYNYSINNSGNIIFYDDATNGTAQNNGWPSAGGFVYQASSTPGNKTPYAIYTATNMDGINQILNRSIITINGSSNQYPIILRTWFYDDGASGAKSIQLTNSSAPQCTGLELGPNCDGTHYCIASGLEYTGESTCHWHNSIIARSVGWHYFEQTYTNSTHGTFTIDTDINFYNGRYGALSYLYPNDRVSVFMGVLQINNLTMISGNTTVYANINSSYFNVSYNNFNYSSDVTLYLNTSQSLLNVSVGQLYTNASISNFNISNNKFVNNSVVASSLLVPANVNNNTLIVNVTGNYSISYVCSGVSLSISTCSINEIYDGLFNITAKNYVSANINNFNINTTNNSISSIPVINTTNGTVYVPVLQNYFYNLVFTGSGYASNNVSLLSNTSSYAYQFNINDGNTVNFTFYDESNLTKITWANISLQLVSLLQSAQYSTTNGTIYSNVISPNTYTVTYAAPNYTTRNYYFVLTNNSHQDINLYMLRNDSSSTVFFTVINRNGKALQDRQIKILRYNINTNSYFVDQIITTDINGLASATLVLNTVSYYFIVQNDDTVELTTSPAYIYSTNVQLTTSASDMNINGIFTAQNIIGNITWNNITQFVTFKFNDLDSVASSGCLYIYNYSVTGTISSLTNSCVSSSAGTITYYIGGNITNTLSFTGIVTKYNTPITVDSLTISYRSNIQSETSSKIGLFVMFLILIEAVFLFRSNLKWMSIVVSIIPFLFSLTGFVNISPVVTVPLFILGIIIAIVIED